MTESVNTYIISNISNNVQPQSVILLKLAVCVIQSPVTLTSRIELERDQGSWWMSLNTLQKHYLVPSHVRWIFISNGDNPIKKIIWFHASYSFCLVLIDTLSSRITYCVFKTVNLISLLNSRENNAFNTHRLLFLMYPVPHLVDNIFPEACTTLEY